VPAKSTYLPPYGTRFGMSRLSFVFSLQEAAPPIPLGVSPRLLQLYHDRVSSIFKKAIGAFLRPLMVMVGYK